MSMSVAQSAVSVVVPVFNSALTLAPLVDRLCGALDDAVSDFEVILVDDGSSDRSWDVAQELASRDGRIRGISLARNYGQHNALLEGVRAATSPVVVTIDDDLQHPPEEIPVLLAKLEEGYDVVYGKPKRSQHPRRRTLASWLLRFALRQALRLPIADDVSAFRAFRTEVREAFRYQSGPYVSLDVLLSWGTTRYASVSVQHDAAPEARSRYSLRSLLAVALNMLTGFSTLPLRIASLIGLGFSILGFAVLAYVLLRFAVAGGSVPGFPFLASIIAVFSGAQLFVIGVIGEYLARMHFRSMGRPSAVVRDRVGFPNSS